MQVTFLGTGTSMGVPIAGGFGRELMKGDPRDERYRCSAWVQHEGRSILIDVGPEFRLQTLRSGLSSLDLLLITHQHTDHIGGLDDLRPFNYVQKSDIPVITTPECEESIKKRFYYMFEPEKTPGSVDLSFQPQKEFYNWFGLNITPLPVYHGEMRVYGYRINDFSYVTDVNYIPEETKKKIKGSKVLVLSGLRWSPKHPTHFTIPEAIEIADELEVEQTWLVHMSVYVNHKETNQKLPSHVQLAYDQLSINV